MSETEIFEMAKRIKKNSETVWRDDEEKVFSCLVGQEYKSLDDIVKETNLSYKAAHVALRKLNPQRRSFPIEGASEEDNDLEIKYTIR